MINDERRHEKKKVRSRSFSPEREKLINCPVDLDQHFIAIYCCNLSTELEVILSEDDAFCCEIATKRLFNYENHRYGSDSNHTCITSCSQIDWNTKNEINFQNEMQAFRRNFDFKNNMFWWRCCFPLNQFKLNVHFNDKHFSQMICSRLTECLLLKTVRSVWKNKPLKYKS